MRVLQTNLNLAAWAQDLLIQTMSELRVGLPVAAEPYRVPNRPDDLGSVAILSSEAVPFSVLAKGRGYVAACYGGLAVVGVYALPSLSHASFETLLDRIRDCVQSHCRARPTLDLEDFNSKATACGCPGTDARGDTVLEWAAGLDLWLLNRGSVNTFSGRWGGSIVDISWASPAAAGIVSGWRVAEEVETLSDHLYILFDISADQHGRPARRPAGRQPSRRWELGRLDEDALMAAALAMSWAETQPEPVDDVEAEEK
ncbi:uncharacterized protein LOC128883598 [Hylaeus volcanicus]|uniref:uncharacterized protein LOC128883598 n=1 Tax=Hylaeus volcanicus TaxID=313075 RepID=UPI0023B791AE|nr:uncharacterized protein LOC128883598 [Hylaeus volcanicus]